MLFQLKEVEKFEGNTIIFPKINLDVHEKEMIAIQCNNEVGKQLINMIIGKSTVPGGEVFFEGVSLNHHFKNLSNRVGVFSLDEGMYERLTLEEYLKFVKRLYDVEADINSLLQSVGLDKKNKIKIGKLSYSEEKRIQLARVILPQPDLLIMEEPDQNIDVESKIIMQRALEDFAGHGKAILIMTNNFESAISMTNIVLSSEWRRLKKLILWMRIQKVQQL